MTTVEKSVTITEEDVVEWCDQSGDSNQIHLSEQKAGESVFGERVVPGMVLLDYMSGLVDQYGKAEGDYAILANIVAMRFREPIALGQDIDLSIECTDSDGKFDHLSFEASVSGTLAAHGTVSVIVKDYGN